MKYPVALPTLSEKIPFMNLAPVNWERGDQRIYNRIMYFRIASSLVGAIATTRLTMKLGTPVWMDTVGGLAGGLGGYYLSTLPTREIMQKLRERNP